MADGHKPLAADALPKGVVVLFQFNRGLVKTSTVTAYPPKKNKDGTHKFAWFVVVVPFPRGLFQVPC